MIRIEAPHFVGAVVLQDDIVVTTAPILKYMRGWSRNKVEQWCRKKHWKYTWRD